MPSKSEIICTCVILSLFPSQLSLSSYRGSLLVPMKIGSQWTKLPVLLPTWNTWRFSVSGASCHSLLRGTLWQPEHNFLWKGIAVPVFSIWTWSQIYQVTLNTKNMFIKYIYFFFSSTFPEISFENVNTYYTWKISSLYLAIHNWLLQDHTNRWLSGNFQRRGSN